MRNLLLTLCAASVAVSCGGSESGEGGGSDAIVVELTGNDQMQYDKTALTVPAGATVTINLTNIGTMPKESMAHNVVLLVSGVTAMDFGGAVAQPDSGANADNGYFPTKQELVDQVVAHTDGQAGPGETVSVTFTAPDTPGTHEYVCTFPGHFAVMRGVLTVE